MDAATLDRRLHFLGRRLGRAQREFGLIAAGDRIAIGFSGGKDSTALMLLLPAWRRVAGLDFELAAVHVEVEGTIDKSLRRNHLEYVSRVAGVPLAFVVAGIDQEEGRPGGRPLHPCFRCSWHRREAMFRWAAGHGFNKVALAHHLDDAAQTALMNLLYKGRLESLAPARSFFAGTLTLIRPLILAQESELARVAACLDTAPLTCACATADGTVPDSARARTRAFLRSLGKEATLAKRHLWRASGAGATAYSPTTCTKTSRRRGPLS